MSRPVPPLATASEADRDLVERDPSLPGLGLVLDDSALSEALGRAVRVDRVRYKPGSSVVASWTGLEDRSHGWVGAYHDPTKAEKALATARRIGAWADLPAGSRHVVAADVLADRSLARPITELQCRHPHLLDAATLLRHNPLRRQVWRTSVDGVDVALRIARVSLEPGRELKKVLRAHGVPVVASTKVKGVPEAELVPWWGEGDLTDHPGPARARATGLAVARLHTTPVESHGGAAVSDPPAPWLPALLTLRPAWQPRLEALRQRLDPALRRTDLSSPVRLHGDLSADQVLVKNDRVRLVDLDRSGVGPRVRDLGAFLAAAHLDGHQALSAPFLDGYAEGGGRWDPSSLAAWQALSLLQRAVEPFRRREGDWSARADQVVTAAEESLP